MGLREVSEILLTFLQYLSMLVKFNIPWPLVDIIPANFLSVFDLDLDFELPYIPPVDYRIHFIGLVSILPLAMSIVMLFVFKPIRVVIWYIVMLSSMALITVGALSMAIPTSSLTGSFPAATVMIIGGSICVFCILLYLVQRYSYAPKSNQVAPAVTHTAVQSFQHNAADSASKAARKRKDEEKGDGDDEADDILDPESIRKALQNAPPRGRAAVVRDVSLATILSLLGLTCYGILPIASVSTDATSNYINLLTRLGQDVGITFLVLAGASFIYCIAMFTQSGRNAANEFRVMLKSNLVRLLLVFFSLVYLPVNNALLSVFLCVRKSCDADSRFLMRTGRSATDSLSAFEKRENMCESCTFLSECPIVNKLCPAVTDLRLEGDITLSCSTDIMPYYWPAAGVMMVAFLFGVPYLFYRITRSSSNVLEEFSFSVQETKTEAERLFDQHTDAIIRGTFGQPQQQQQPTAMMPMPVAMGMPMQQQPHQVPVVVAWQPQMAPMYNPHMTPGGGVPMIDLGQQQQLPQGYYNPQPLTTVPVQPIPITNPGLTARGNRASARNNKDPEAETVDIPPRQALDMIKSKSSNKSLSRKQKKWLEDLRENMWKSAIQTSGNAGKALYQAFQYRWRYYKLILIIQKLAIVTSTLFLTSTSSLGSVAVVAVVHLAATGVYLYSRPYMSKAEDSLSTTCSLVNTINAGLVLASATGRVKSFPSWLTTLITFLNIAIFPFAILVLVYVFTKNRREKQKREEEWKKLDEYSRHINQDNNGLSLREMSKLVDRRLNEFVLKTMVNFFLFLGVCSFAALAFAVVGAIRGSTNQNFVPARIDKRTSCGQAIKFEYAGYQSWEEFSSKCCCSKSKPDSTYLSVEMWTCLNGMSKERVREEKVDGEERSGLLIRPFCSLSFNSTMFTPPSRCGTGFSTKAACLTDSCPEYAVQYLW